MISETSHSHAGAVLFRAATSVVMFPLKARLRPRRRAEANIARPANLTREISQFSIRRGGTKRLQVNRVMDILGITPGKTVADIGAGSGWFTVRAARRVGESGMVYAVDINPEAIRYIDERAQKEKLHNVKTILGKADDPLLPAEFRRCGFAAEDVSRSCGAGGSVAEPARGASSRREGWHHRPQWKWRGPWCEPRCRPA